MSNLEPGCQPERQFYASSSIADFEILELHWYEATGIGRYEFKIKRYLD